MVPKVKVKDGDKVEGRGRRRPLWAVNTRTKEGIFMEMRTLTRREEEDDEWTEVIRNKPKSPANRPAQSQEETSENRPSFASVTAQQSSSLHQHSSRQDTSQQLRRNSDASIAAMSQRKTLQRIFKTAPPNRPMRDDLVIEIQKINGKPFRGQLTFTEAKDGIFTGCLDLNIKLIHGIRFGFNTYPTIKYKLRNK